MPTAPYAVAVSDADLNDLRRRLSATRFAAPLLGPGWDAGVDQSILETLIARWRDGYDWRTREAALNGFPHFTAQIDGQTLHFIHARADAEGAIPLLLLHGWPGSFVQMLPLIPRLTAPGEGPAFDVVAVSLPGYGFSPAPTVKGLGISRIALLMHSLMTEALGYARYGLRSSDLGAGIAARLAADHPESVIGSHTGGTNPWLQQVPEDLTAEEKAYVQAAQAWMQSEMAYAQLHASKPQTLAAALTDSPAGLAAWIIEKVWRWGDTETPLTARIDADALLDNLSVYWFSRSIGPSMRLYYESVRDPGAWAQPAVPTAMLMSSHDMFPTPRSWVERQGPVTRWTEIDKGGHFLEWEVPDLVAADLKAFFGGLK